MGFLASRLVFVSALLYNAAMLANRFNATTFKALVNWYAVKRRYDPWSHISSAYQVWLSEVMLQQTTVQAVAPYFERWLKRWPDAFAIAQSTEEEVLRAWEGLGYYRRARSFYHACLQLHKDNYRQPPADYDYLISLPGIGEYTATAILSFAYHLNYAVFDTNVARICQRLSASEQVNNKIVSEWKKVLHNQLNQQSALWNNAIMQLGQQLCRAQNPRCKECPWQNICQAYAQGKTHCIPARRQKKIIDSHLHTALILDPQKRLLFLRKRRGALANLWRLPSWSENTQNPYSELLKNSKMLGSGASLSREDHNIWEQNKLLLKEEKHFYVNRCDYLKPRLYLLAQKKEAPKEHEWHTLDALCKLPMPSAYRRIINQIYLK